MPASDSKSAPRRVFGWVEIAAFMVLGVATLIKAVASLGLTDFLLPTVVFLMLQLGVLVRRTPPGATRHAELAALLLLAVVTMATSHNQTLLMTVPLMPIAALLEGMLGAWVMGAALALATATVTTAYGDPLADRVEWIASHIGATLFLLAFSRLLLHERQRRELLRRESQLAQELSAAAERERIAAELHDGLGHHLSGALIQIEAARAVGGPSLEGDHLDRARSLIRGAMAEVRLVMAGDLPPGSRRPLLDSLQDLVRESVAAGIPTRLVTDPVEDDRDVHGLSPTSAYALWRGVQEALTNVRRHATGVREVTVSVASSTAGTHIVVRDDGDGASTVDERVGLRSMRERMRQAGGHARYTHGVGEGFTVELGVPR